MTTPRIDATRKQIDDLIALLHACRDELDDLHLLAYERRVAASERVRTSTTDYALDTHGDPRARNAYRRLAGAVLAATEPVAIACHQAHLVLSEGSPPGPNRLHERTCTTIEVVAALKAQARRAGRDEYTAHRTWPQPKPGS